MVMKIIYLILITTITFNSAFSQDLYIIQSVKGKVRQDGKVIKAGDKVKSTDKLIFEKGSALLVSSQKLGRLVIQQTQGTFNSETAYLFSDLMPKKKNASTRGGLCSSLEFRQHFKDSVFRVYGTTAFSTCQNSFPQDSARFFYLQYLYNNQTINKQLSGSGDFTVMDHKIIFSINGQPVNQSQVKRVSLFYYDPSKKINEKLASFKLELIPVDDTVKEDLKKMILMLSANSGCYADVVETVHHHLEMLYGQSSTSNISEWIATDFNLSKDKFMNCR